MVRKIIVKLPVIKPMNYEIKIQRGLLQRSIEWLPRHYRNIVIITDNVVYGYYGKTFARQLKSLGYSTLLLSFASGEKSKNAKTKQKLEEKILTHNYGRNDTLICALGGGVVGDLAGFIAATYMRGIPYIQIPTTLLAMVDSSVGGKVAVDTRQGKNLIGAFWQPSAVIADIDCLKTLDKKNRVSGLVEAIKMFLTNDAKSFHFVGKNIASILSLDTSSVSEVIYRAVKIKSYVISQDETETNMRMTLNFGHTIGHALEKISFYKIPHGYAVAYGILVEAKISQLMGILDEAEYLMIESIFKLIGIHKKILRKYTAEKIVEETRFDKKAQNGLIYCVLLKKIGCVYTLGGKYAHSVSEKIIKKSIRMLQDNK